MDTSLHPLRCLIHTGQPLEERPSPLGRGLKVRACPVRSCDYQTASYTPSPTRRRREAAVGVRREGWRRYRWDLDRDERGDA